jgi:hypothetical protein
MIRHTIILTLLLSPVFKLWGGDQRYASADRHALSAPAAVGESVESLSAYLTRPFNSDEDKARAIFRWITENISYDVERYFSKKTSSDCRDVLKSRSSVCGGYSNLFQTLCRKAGLEAVTIGGSAKGYFFRAGDSESKLERHAWNGIKLHGKWKLVDCTWGAGKVDEKHNYRKEFEPYYFLTRPEEFIYRHYPDSKRWQLLPKPVSGTEFENYPLVTPAFFECGIKLTGMKFNSVNITGEYLTGITAPPDVMLTATLEREEEICEDAVFLQRSGSAVTVMINPPESGEYFLNFFAKKGWELESLPQAVSFRIIARLSSPNSTSYPAVFKAFIETKARLISPLTKHLASGSVQHFSLSCPGAEKVAVICGDEWDYLKNKSGLFEGDVEIGAGKLTLVAGFPGRKEFDALLEYSGTGDYRRASRPVRFEKFMKTGAELYSPLVKELPAGTVQHFRIKIPGAKKAAVIFGEEWKYLKKNGEIFEGKFDIPAGRISVVAAYTETREFDGLLEFEGK